jgi:RimJ/RimL family protein N-acetyltransferase
MGAATILTQRLAMTPMSCEAMRAIMAADWQRADELLATPFPTEWRSDGWEWLAPRVVEGDHDARLLVWGTRLARLIDGRGQAVAEVGFHGPPDDHGWVEIGYRVVTGYRRRGFAEEACRGLLDWAFTTGVAGVRAAISPDNEASARLAQKLGFARAGRARHEVLGEQLIFKHPRGSYGCLG